MDFIRWFDQISLDDIPLVGGKCASLGEMYRQLSPMGIMVPNGFAVTVDAYQALLDHEDLRLRLRDLMQSLDVDDESMLAEIGHKARMLILETPLPASVGDDILIGYQMLQNQYGYDVPLAVRSSATAEDLPEASFAGQHESFLNVTGEVGLLSACQRCLASLFTDRAISYRCHHGFDHFKVSLAIAVMKMVRSDKAASGVMFSLDTESGFPDVVLINSSWGLGENIVQGMVDPDEFYVHKPTFQHGFRTVLRRVLGKKQLTMHVGRTVNEQLVNERTPAALQKTYSLSDKEVLQLADYAIKIESHYSLRHQRHCPMDMEWAKDADDGRLYLVQARPETVASRKVRGTLTRYRLQGTGHILAIGRAIGTGIVSGRISKISSPDELVHFKQGDILFADSTSPDWGPAMRRAGGLITVRGGRTCHAAIVAREFGIPAVVGIGSAEVTINDQQMVTLSCANGDNGQIFDGVLPFDQQVTVLGELPGTATQMMINLGSPDQAFQMSALPCDGIGLARMEFIISESILAHPMALLYPQQVRNLQHRKAINALIDGYGNGAAYFIEKLSEGMATLAAAFYPKPVIVRTSDFKSNEYANLLGGADFEPREENPMLGFRGAARYIHPAYAEGFDLECRAFQRARDVMGFNNLKVMIPFCRRVDEARQVIAAMGKAGLRQGVNGLKIYLMCEIPNNVIQIDEFSRLFDGISIGSNDLTQLVLGVDRDSENVAFDFDERDPGVLAMLKMAIEGARRNGIPVGICGQAPSDYPEVTEFLVNHGINSISLNPDALVETINRVATIEKALMAHHYPIAKSA